MTPKEVNAKEILFKLLKAFDEEEVRQIIETDDFFKNGRWKPYGGYDGNFNTIHNQQQNSVAALIEKPINSIDAILTKECKLKGVDPTSQEAPKSMQEAVEQFFDIKKGDFSEATSKKRRELASNIRIIAEGSKEKPNIIVLILVKVNIQATLRILFFHSIEVIKPTFVLFKGSIIWAELEYYQIVVSTTTN